MRSPTSASRWSGASARRLSFSVELHSFRRADARPLVPGGLAGLRIGLLPASVLFKQGHRIRLAIAGADTDTFGRVPAAGTPTITVQRNSVHASSIELPLRNR